MKTRTLSGATITIVAAFLVSFFAPVLSYSNETSEVITLGLGADYSLASGRTIVLGATPFFSGLGSRLGASYPNEISNGMIESLKASGITIFENKNETARLVLANLKSASTRIRALKRTAYTEVLSASKVGPGVYEPQANAALNITTPFVFDGGGDLNSQFVFRTDGALTIAANLTFTWINGAQPSHIYWYSNSATTIYGNTSIPGNFIAGEALTTGASTKIYGAVLGLFDVNIGALTEIIHVPLKVPASKPPISTPTPTPTPTPSKIVPSSMPSSTSQSIKTSSPLASVKGDSSPLASATSLTSESNSIDYPDVTIRPVQKSITFKKDAVRIVLHNLVPGQKIKIVVSSVQP